MNKRQWKKKYKKEHGCNPPRKRQVQTWEEAVSAVTDMVIQMFKTIKEFTKELQVMPEDEFKEKILYLTPEQQQLTRKIRNNGKERDKK